MTTLWTPTLQGDEPDPLRSAVFQAIGSALMCWEEIPHGVFDSTKAKWVGDGLLAWLDEHMDDEVRRLRSTWIPPEDATNTSTYGYTLEHGVQGIVEAPRSLAQDLATVLNMHSAENVSDTPDFILAEMLCGVLEMFDAGIRARGQWYGHQCSIGACDHGDGLAVGYDADPEDGP